MKNTELLKEIYRESKSMNRNLLRIANIGLIGLLGKAGENAKKEQDKTGRVLVKTGLVLLALSEILILVTDIVEIGRFKAEEQQ